MSSGLDSSRKADNKVPFLGSGMEWVVLLISLLVAAIVWLVYNLSLPYSTFLDFPVHITSDIPGYESRADTDQRMIIRGKAAGFYIIYRKATSGREPLEINVDSKYLIPVDEKKHSFLVSTTNLRKETSALLGGYVDIEYIVTDTLSFSLTPTDMKKVPVRANASLSCASQYHFYSDLKLQPDSVFISGRASIVSSIDAVWTERIYRTGIDGNIQGMANLVTINGLDFSTSNVMYSADVKRYVEETVTVPVTVIHLPPDRKAVLVPDQVDMTFRRWYPLAGKIEPYDFKLVIDYEKYVKSSSSTVIPVLMMHPDETFDFHINPEIVECILLKK